VTRFLFTTLPTNDLGLLTRSMPIAHALSDVGHEVVFSSPATAPSRVLADAGFANLTPPHPLYDLASGDRNLRGLIGLLTNRRWRQHGISPGGRRRATDAEQSRR
jgi:UDP:flavonoid glycosyltransferase YjiC (YdhE family)